MRGNSSLHSLHFTRSSLPCPPEDERSRQSSQMAKYTCFADSNSRKSSGLKLVGGNNRRQSAHSYSFSFHICFVSGITFFASHAKHSARLVRVRCFFHCSKRGKEKACKGFLMYLFFALEHFWHFTFSALQAVHKHSDEEL